MILNYRNVKVKKWKDVSNFKQLFGDHCRVSHCVGSTYRESKVSGFCSMQRTEGPHYVSFQFFKTEKSESGWLYGCLLQDKSLF